MGYHSAKGFGDAGLAFARARAAGKPLTQAPVRADTIPIGSNLLHTNPEQDSHAHRRGLVSGTFHITDRHGRTRPEYTALEITYATTHIDRHRLAMSEVGQNHVGKYVMDRTAALANTEQHFKSNPRNFGEIDPLMWPEVIAARVYALLHCPKRQETPEQSILHNGWTRRGIVLDIPRSSMRDQNTFAPDNPNFYPPQDRKRALEYWSPKGMSKSDIQAIIGVVREEGFGRYFIEIDHHEEKTAARREALRAALPHYYARHDRKPSAAAPFYHPAT
jgi:hypothetical protein